jgi:hypothetical protein
MKPVPIRDLDRQLATVGRIRTGRKTSSRSGQQRPAALPAFRFTSSDEVALGQVAAIYGGTVRPWKDPASPDAFELYSDATEIKVALPRAPLTQWYELWSGGGCQRRCDGLTCTLLQGAGQDGGDSHEVNCMCAARGEMACEKKTRLSVLLPEVRLLGTWRYDTGSDIAASEIAAAVDLIEAVQARGIQRAVLRLAERRAQGRRRQFTIAMLGLDESLDGLIAGANQIAVSPGPVSAPSSLSSREVESAPALGAGDPETYDTDLDKTIVDAELVGGPAAPVEQEGEVERGGLPADAPSLSDPVDGELVRAWLLSVSTGRRGRLLTRAREIAEAADWDPPTYFEGIPLAIASVLQEEDFHAHHG